MTTTPPFDPPYKLRIASEAGERWVELRADGTQIDTAAPPKALHFAEGATSQASSAGGKSAKTPAKKSAMILNVPFAEKDEAKRLGAKWDAAQRKWYVPQGVDVAGFSRWMPQTKD